MVWAMVIGQISISSCALVVCDRHVDALLIKPKRSITKKKKKEYKASSLN